MVRRLAAAALVAVAAGCSTTVPTPTATEEPVASRTTSVPSGTTSPSATAVSGDPAVEIAAEEIGRHLEALQSVADNHGGIRAAGTAGYDASAEYVAAQLEAAGLDVELHELDFTSFEETSPVSVAVDGESWTGPEWLHAMLYSASGNVSGEVETVGIADGRPQGSAGCEAGDWEEFEPGNVALLMSGRCFRREQVMLAQQAGAVGFVALYPQWRQHEIRRPTLVEPEGVEIPVVAAGRDPAEALLRAAEAGATTELRVEVAMSPARATSVLAELPGRSDEVIMVGAHLDSVLDGPGMNDNASGTAVTLAMAAALASEPAPNPTVRFAFWAAEEYGVVGSTQYVGGLSEADQDLIQAYLNVDMVGSPNAGRFVYDEAQAASGSDELTRLLQESLEAHGTPALAVDIGGSSDHGPFQRAGIATGGVFSGATDQLSEEEATAFGATAGEQMDPCYHLPCDDLANVNLDSARILGQALTDAVLRLAWGEE